jgi:hypothetical protein
MSPLFGPSTQPETASPSRLLAFIVASQVALVFDVASPAIDPAIAAQLRLLRAMELARKESAK